MYAKEDILFKALKVQERRANSYCQRVRPEVLEKIRKIPNKSITMDRVRNVWYLSLIHISIAEEIKHRKAERKTEVILAVGLPLSSFGREKQGFRAVSYTHLDVYKRQQRDSFPFLPYVIAYSNDSIVEA